MDDIVTLEVNETNRLETCQNHSATHLLQYALKNILSDEVSQKGSYVDNNVLRFDFNYSDKLDNNKIVLVEEKVNELINNGYNSSTELMDIDTAKKSGAVALFDEKYGDKVRVVKLGPSVELCGGTHVKNTSDIKRFAIKQIESKGLNIYRIEAACDKNIEEELFKVIKPYNDEMIMLFKKAKKIINEASDNNINLSFDMDINNDKPSCYTDILQNKFEVESLRKKVADLDKKYKEELTKKALSNTEDIINEKTSGIYSDVIIKVFENSDINTLKQLVGAVLSKLDNAVIVLINKTDSSLNFVAKASPNLSDKINVGMLIKEISNMADGNGGGSPLFAQGGGTNPRKLDEILIYLNKKLIKE